MLSETSRNTGGMEKAGPWGKYVTTGIDPKKREANEKRRDLKATERRNKSRKKKGEIEPRALARAKPEGKEGEEAWKGKEKERAKKWHQQGRKQTMSMQELESRYLGIC